MLIHVGRGSLGVSHVSKPKDGAPALFTNFSGPLLFDLEQPDMVTHVERIDFIGTRPCHLTQGVEAPIAPNF